MKKALLLTTTFILSMGLLACSSNKSTAPTTMEAKPVAPAADKIGVPECDEYVEKYQKCLMGKVPEMARGQLKSAFDQTVSGWKQAAATPMGKTGLGMGCKMALDAAKQSTVAFGCEW